METDQGQPVTAWRRTYTALAWLPTGTLGAVAVVIMLDDLFGTFSDGLGGLGRAIQLGLLLAGASFVGGVLSALGPPATVRSSLKAAGIVAAASAFLLLLASIL